MLTIVYEMAGHEDWLRLRLVCKLFDDSSYSMAKIWPVNAKEVLSKLLDEEQRITEDQGWLLE